MLLESYPDDLEASLAAHAAWRRDRAAEDDRLEFLVSDLARWRPGSTVRVAFLDGDRDLHRMIAEATTAITDACNIGLDFGHDPDTGGFRRWTTDDREHAAEIRVSFDLPGYWSLVGTASANPAVGPPDGAAGGRAHQRSLNLGGFADSLPPSWQGTVLHEFLHALGFGHEHQNTRGPCQDEFRWEDDEGYEPTTDWRGRYVADAEGRRPGVYTYLSGEPNNWSRAKVDHNLRGDRDDGGVVSAFDAESVMLYRFGPLFYRTDPSPCAPTGDGGALSDGDRRGLTLLYPATGSTTAELAARATAALDALGERADADTREAVDVRMHATTDLLAGLWGGVDART